MERQIPLTFESTILASSCEAVTTVPNTTRAKVRVFSKYANRNGSYITDQVAEQLIDSAINKPVVGWYDPQTGTWAGHVGPELAQAYGYVDSFLGWEPFTDTDGITRNYAVFSVMLFSEYFDAANKIVGANQSMELNPESIKGDWVDIEGNEYYAFTQAQMYSFCVIGTKEPCFSVSAFFTKNTVQYEKLQNLVFEMRRIIEGGNTTMEENTNVVEEQDIVLPEAQENVEPKAEETVVEPVFTASETETEEPALDHSEEVTEEPEEAINYEALYSELQTTFNELQANYDAATERITSLESAVSDYEAQINDLNNQITTANNRISGYELEAATREASRIDGLFASYSENLTEDEIGEIRSQSEGMSYNDIEAKLAITFSRKQLTKNDEVRVPLNETPESEFALFMSKYKKNR